MSRQGRSDLGALSATLAGKTVLITGAARRIGRATALRLAECGANIAFTYRNSEADAQSTLRALAKLDVDASAVRCDVSDELEVNEAVVEIAKQFGGIDVLVNNAGMYETADLDTISVTQWDRMFATNVRGPFLVARAAHPHLKKAHGRIVNIGSLGGIRPWSSHAHYCASKAALHMLTELMAKAMAPEVAVNCVAPGMISAGEKQDVELSEKVAKKTPMHRAGTPDDVAEAILFFAAGPHFVTGQVLVVDGGLMLAT